MILGGGTGGTLLANRLRRRFDDEYLQIDVVDRDDVHVYQPGMLFVPFGLADPDEIVRPRRRQLHKGIGFHQVEIESVDLGAERVHLADGSSLPYDVLVVASGARLQPEETEGLLGAGWNETAFTFYELDSATKLRDALARFEGGRLVVDIADMPIKCPVAPIEFAFLADWFLRERGVRERCEIVLATPLDGCFTKPIASKHLTHLLDEKGIRARGRVQRGRGRRRRAASSSRTTAARFSTTFSSIVPLHGGAAYVGRSEGLGDALGFVPTDPATLQAHAAPNVFALGDATDLPSSKAGSVTHFEGEILTENIERFLTGRELTARFDGHSNCFVETGFHKALLIDFNYETEPVTGRFPTAAGPLPLLRESRLNHLGKLMFQWIYWHMLLPGRELPLVGPAMPTAGKRIPTAV